MAGFRKVLNFVNRVFSSKHIILVNTAASGILMGMGDVTMQIIEKRYSNEEHALDLARTGRMALVGLASGPLTHGWYSLVDKMIPGVTGSTVLRKILLDQCLASPFFTCYFFTVIGSLEGHKPKECLQTFSSKFWEVYRADWMFWPAAQSVNFRFVPSRYRVIYIQSASYLWDTFMSYINHKMSYDSLFRKFNIVFYFPYRRMSLTSKPLKIALSSVSPN
ncbi:hypothetical protein CAPTEDRAFT_146770 [Capitella teleta]|uniref:Mpv17-like protein 2 n=1 Tax=Capitella teleta TaxID=283909 RepID=R7TLQ0_CAPTE|nr:hypothetical protein CAPTEDRAFT_146770 [Capitella teleta]|eukprot:ELT94432.1 hypothetical protein CAPTEDRAFT_146770 [Capitella teleta]